MINPDTGEINRFLRLIPVNSSILIVGIGDGKTTHDISQAAHTWMLSLELMVLEAANVAQKFEKDFRGFGSGVFLVKWGMRRKKPLCTVSSRPWKRAAMCI